MAAAAAGSLGALTLTAGAALAERRDPEAANRIVLHPGKVEVYAGTTVPLTVRAPEALDLTTLTELVDDASLLHRTADGTIHVRAPIDQRPGSRLALNGDTSATVRFQGHARLLGSGAILSINRVSIVASGAVGGVFGPIALIGYDAHSGVRMSRVRIRDHRTGPGAGRVVDMSAGELRIVSGQFSGGNGGIRLESVNPAELTGVTIADSRGSGLVAGGKVGLHLRDVTIARNQGGGVLLTGRRLSLVTGGRVDLVDNSGAGLMLQHTRTLDLSDVRRVSSTGQPPTELRPGPTGPHLDLIWVIVVAALLAVGAVGVEVVRNR